MTTPEDARGSNDEALVERARSGDEIARGELVRRHRPRVFSLVRRYADSDSEADDVVQAVFERAYLRLSQFRGEALYSTWLYRIAVNVALNHRRGKARTLPLDDVVEAATHPFATLRLVARETRAKLAVAIEELPPMQRRVVELRLLEELPFSEIAVQAGCSEDSAKANYHFAIKKLRMLLKQ